MAVELSSTSVTEGTAITVTMSFSNLESDDDRATTDYLFRADVVDADGCEDQAGGYGLGVDRKINLVDEEPEIRRGTISADCPAGDYTVRATVSSPQDVELASATADFSVAEPEPPASNDAALSGLPLSGVTLEFDSDTTSYTAEVVNDVAETTVSPTLNDAGATYAVRLDGEVDDDGIVPLSVGENAISVLVTAEDGETTRTYTVTVTRAEAPPELSRDAALKDLALSGVTLEFDPATTTYTAEVGNDLAETTVSPTLNDAGATYAVRLDGAADDDGIVPLVVGGNAISVVVTAEDGETTRTYTVTVTRAEPPASGPGVSIELSPVSVIEGEGDEIAVTMSFGNLTFDDDRTTIDYIFRADAKDSEDGDADGCENQAGGYGLGVDRKINLVDEDPEVRRGAISADCPAGVYTLRVSISADSVELASATAAFYVLPPLTAVVVERPEDEEPRVAQQNVADATLSALTVSPVDIIGFDSDTTTYRVGVANSVTQATVTATTNEANATIDIGGTAVDSGAGHQVTLDEGLNIVTITVTAEDGNTDETYGIGIGRGVTTAFGWKATDDFYGLHAHGISTSFGIWSNGTIMWVLEGSVSKIYAFNLASKAHEASEDFDTLTAAGNTRPEGIWSDGTIMWVSDSQDDKIYAYDMATKAQRPSEDFNTLGSAGNNIPSGLTSDGVTMWVTDYVDDKLYAYELGTKARDSEKDFNNLVSAGRFDPHAMWSDGVTMWMAVTGGGVKLLAYDMVTKARVPGNDFNALSGAVNRAPRGMWSDGETMWVSNADYVVGRIHSYNMPPSRNAFLESISVNGLPVPGVNRADTAYTHTVAVTETTVTVAAPAAHSNAGVSITPADSSAAAGHQVALNPDGETPTEVTITVTAEDGTTRTYTLRVEFRPKDAPPALQGLKLVYRPALERILIGRCSGAPGITCAVGAPGTTAFDVDTGTADAVTVVATPVSPHATVSIDHPDFDRDAGGHQVMLAGRGTSLTIEVTVANRDGARATYRINVTRQLSGDTRLGELSLTKTGDGVFAIYESLYPMQPDSNLEPEFITEWNEATGQPRRARYRATLLFNERDGTAENAVVRVVGQPLHTGAAVRIHGESSDTSPFRHVFRFTVDDTGEQQALRVELDVQAENGDIHVYELVIVKRYLQGSSPPALAKVFKGVNEWDQKPSLFVDWRDGQSCTKPYNVATEYITDTHQGWLSHPVTNEREFLDEGEEEYTLPQRTHLWLDSESLEAAFGPATAERRDTTIEVWCGPRPYSYKDEDGNDQQANDDSRLVGTATIEFPDAPPAPEEPTAAPETPTGLAGRLIVHRAELTWNTVAGATGYELSIWDGEAWIDSNHDIFTDPDRSSLTAEIGDGEATVSPLYESSHQFRVRAVNQIGSSGWSEAVTVED